MGQGAGHDANSRCPAAARDRLVWQLMRRDELSLAWPLLLIVEAATPRRGLPRPTPGSPPEAGAVASLPCAAPWAPSPVSFSSRWDVSQETTCDLPGRRPKGSRQASVCRWTFTATAIPPREVCIFVDGPANTTPGRGQQDEARGAADKQETAELVWLQPRRHICSRHDPDLLAR